MALTEVTFTEVVGDRGRSRPPRNSSKRACFYCKKEGHILKDCPNLVGAKRGTILVIWHKATRTADNPTMGVAPAQKPAQNNNNDTKAAAAKPKTAGFNNGTVNVGGDDNTQLPTTTISYQD